MADTIQLGDIRFYTDEDPYHYTVDNRPLQDLEQNDIVLKTAVEAVLATINSGFQSRTFVSGTDFIPGTTTVLDFNTTLGSAKGFWVFFDGVYQNASNYVINIDTVVFNSPIPVGVTSIEVKWSNIGLVNVPAVDVQPISNIIRSAVGQILSFREGTDVVNITYNANGSVNQITGSGQIQTVTYDSNGNVTGIIVS